MGGFNRVMLIWTIFLRACSVMYFQEKTEAGLQHNKVNYGWATPSTIHFDPMDRLKEPKP